MLPVEQKTNAATEPDESGPRRRWWTPIRMLLLAVAALLGLYSILSQVLALVPVSWTGPLLRLRPLQAGVLSIGWFRDSFGSWNVVVAVVAVFAALVAIRLRRTRPAGSVAAASVTGLVLCLVTSVGLALSAHAATGSWTLFAPLPLVSAGKVPNETVTYATLDGQRMQADLYLPPASAAPAPLVVNIHGGGFIAGSRGPSPYNHWLAGRGYAVLDVDYRLSDSGTLRWNTEDADVGCAMTWAAANAGRYRWDMNRVATFGGSAGGNLAINVAYKANAGRLRPSCGTAAEIPKVRAVVAVYPAVNLTASADDSAEGEHVAREYIGGSAAEFPDRYAATDSAPQITPAAPPTLLFQGRGDHLVFASHTAQFADRLTAAGIRNRYVELPFLDHGFDAEVLNTGAEVGREVTLDWLERYDKP
ncbi:alpha/beta hydrolase [Nocardia wallacei]|uniref:alpha/beta hydrolase n=1 Tax=Nocardia wallacei TaxID=480035 RepID=UPI002454EB4F|nr:alpha/beta hydrolase [Nocardia wallacei]